VALYACMLEGSAEIEFNVSTFMLREYHILHGGLGCVSSSHASNQPNPQPLVGKTLESILVLSEEL
jgi:hypothetical protein